jgi:hypothetical protein
MTTVTIHASLPTAEGIAAWAAAASQAGAVLPGRVAQALERDWDDHGHKNVSDVEDLWDVFDVLEAVADAARSVCREHRSEPVMPRGMEVGIAPNGYVSLVWRSESHTITLQIIGGWSTADTHRADDHWDPDMSESVLLIEVYGERDPLASPRALAAMAASETLKRQGWC